ncbi:hypothetical protein [Emticicia sp. BO119]|uniref:hypothetical protein n=1 Tax=Emticicia sp. BO119 TaxID=2757768 RepID=UPI0015F08369|nr:hypothetical protein [Emticicia sp. BO119]MBA4849467.1 hypothetical protein [Emticicia sp. BO119]
MCHGQCRFQTHSNFTTCIACGFTAKTAVFEAAFEENEETNFDYSQWAQQQHDWNEPINDHWDEYGKENTNQAGEE